MASSKNPLKGAFKAHTQSPRQEPHARSLHSPTHKAKVAHKGRPSVEMPRGHGARASAKGRDMLHASDKKPHLPGRKEPSGIQRVGKGAMRFGDQGLGY